MTVTCCFILTVDIGSICIGIGSLILSTFITCASIAFFAIGSDWDHLEGPLSQLLGLDLTLLTLHIILAIIIVVSALWMIASMLLIIGVIKNRSGFVLFYFGIGVVVTIYVQLGGLLLLLHQCWGLASVMFILSGVHIHLLIVIHSVHELMQKGIAFRFHHLQEDMDSLSEFDDVLIDD